MPRKINLIVIHCSDSPNGRPQTVEDIDSWHRERGFLRRAPFKNSFNSHLTSIGYQFVIYTDGSTHTGRALEEIGAHAAGYNTFSIGICLIGKDQFTPAQWESLRILVRTLEEQYPNAVVKGHHDLPSVKKSCPNFDVTAWMSGNMTAQAGHVLTA